MICRISVYERRKKTLGQSTNTNILVLIFFLANEEEKTVTFEFLF